MSGSRRGDRPKPSAAETDPGLLELGLRPGDVVRYRRREGGVWHEAVVERRERDGSVGVRDERGAARALVVDRLQVRATGSRGGTTWEPLATRADRDEQLGLF